MKKLIVSLLILYGSIASAAQGVDQSIKILDVNESTQGASKMLTCIAASETAIDAFELKQNKKKLVYHKTDDILAAVLVKKAMDAGYKSKSVADAAKAGFESCIKSKIWNENSQL